MKILNFDQNIFAFIMIDEVVLISTPNLILSLPNFSLEQIVS